jgi:hypothetical protein
MYQILSPLRSIDEIDILIQYGAGEFYCGLLMGENTNLNDRPNTNKFNFSNIEELQKAIIKIH